MDYSDTSLYEIAWKRVKDDLRDQTFLDHPHKETLIEFDLKPWLLSIQSDITSKTYNPSPCDVVFIPKPKGHIRPGGILTIKDHLVYSAILLADIEPIAKKLHWSANYVRFSSLLRPYQEGKSWFDFTMQGWSKFRDKSLELMLRGNKYAVIADISAYFENIDIGRLLSDMKGITGNTISVELLSKCLNRWSGQRGRGIPQGFHPSAILSEIYLNSIDQRLVDKGVAYVRYVDDIRMFFRSEREAIRGLHYLTKLLRVKGLNLQTAKTSVLTCNQARKRISGLAGKITELRNDIEQELKDMFELNNPYSSPADIRRLLKLKNVEIDLQALKQAFCSYFLTKKGNFDKSYFHFIINRLAALKDQYAVEYCYEQLQKRPEETKSVLDYFSCLDSVAQNDIATRISQLIVSDAIVFKHQYTLFLKWFIGGKIALQPVVEAVRIILEKYDVHSNTRDYCIAYLGEYGNQADLDLIETMYARMERDISKATVIIALNKLETGRRNALYARVERDSYYVSLAVKYVKTRLQPKGTPAGVS